MSDPRGWDEIDAALRRKDRRYLMALVALVVFAILAWNLVP